MHPLTLAKRLLLGGLVATSVVTSGGRAVAQQQPPAAPPAANQPNQLPLPVTDVRVGRSGELYVAPGTTAKYKPRRADFSDAASTNPTVFSVELKKDDPSTLMLTGLAPGVGRLTLGLPGGKFESVEVIVQPDYDYLRKVIAQAVPTASVQVVPGVGAGVILTGYVNKPEDAAIVVQIATAAVSGASTTSSPTPGSGAAQTSVINAIQVGGVQHVQIEVVIAQVDRTELRERGFDFQVTGASAQFGSFISSLIATPVVGSGNGQANLQLGLASPGIFTALRALRTEGVAKFLSEPKVVTQSGRPAVITSGGQQAVLSASGGGLGSISVTLESIGTNLEVLPIVYGNGKIYLEVNPRVRQRNDGFGIQTSAGFSPGFTEQSTSASVMLESGQTFALGGLLESSAQTTKTGVPVLGDLPFVGTAFSTIRIDERERELVILVTPRLVDAMDCAQVPKRVPGRETRQPDDYELFLEGLLEAPRGQRQVWNGRCYNAAWKCDPNGCFPCKGDVCTGKNGCAPCVNGECGGTAAGHVLPPAWAAKAAPTVGLTATPVLQTAAPVTPVVVIPAEATVEPPPVLTAPPMSTDPLPVAPVIPVVPVIDPPTGGSVPK